ncbi:aminotransferase class IV family protein [Pararhizobium sp. BT-229]|uniref:aminotransferase class IV family protein n=1 Tax=Pararhizobium sp. BT-229 TaxID=2986923 RepID=UPI0021F78179|nr:aminotransferase class IV family protein [Pararhizobium sp. BT-229]MCV9966457.1 aminotransferase class IV family protein [Pararhizobium sp. BT-229]
MNDFSLIETMRWGPGTGIVRLRLHLARLKRSAGRLGFPGAERAEEKLAEVLGESLPPSALSGISPSGGEIAGDATLVKAGSGLISPLEGEMSARPTEGGKAPHAAADQSPLRVRLTLSPSGEIAVTTAPFTPLPENTIWRIAIASTRLDSANKLLRHKTTRREIYENARAEYPATDADEVLLLNEKGEPCEGTITSIFLDDGTGILKTPPISCGLLAGVLRTELICTRRARIQRLTLGDLRGGGLYVGNSLRGLIKAELISA